jgi:hypothetical protein
MDCRNVDYVCPMFISPVNYGEHFPFVSMSVTSEAAKVELKFPVARHFGTVNPSFQKEINFRWSALTDSCRWIIISPCTDQ